MDRHPKGWRGEFKRKIVLVLLAKLVGLIVLWLLFFSPAHRTSVDEALAERQFSLAPENEK